MNKAIQIFSEMSQDSYLCPLYYKNLDSSDTAAFGRLWAANDRSFIKHMIYSVSYRYNTQFHKQSQKIKLTSSTLSKTIPNSEDIMKSPNQGVKQISTKCLFGLTFSVQVEMWEMWRETTTLMKAAEDKMFPRLVRLPLVSSACSLHTQPTEQPDPESIRTLLLRD